MKNPTIQAEWRVTATDDTRQDTRTVWATDAGTAIVTARKARDWPSLDCGAERVSNWYKIHVCSLDGGSFGWWKEELSPDVATLDDVPE